MTKWNGLNRNNPPRKVSKKKQRAIAQEAKVHAVIKERSQNKCEICKFGATPPSYKIEFHEIVFRSAGGKVDETNTFGIDFCCHWILQHYLFMEKPRCINFIIVTRKTDIIRATEIYRRIYEFAKEHNLLRKSKLGG